MRGYAGSSSQQGSFTQQQRPKLSAQIQAVKFCEAELQFWSSEEGRRKCLETISSRRRGAALGGGNPTPGRDQRIMQESPEEDAAEQLQRKRIEEAKRDLAVARVRLTAMRKRIRVVEKKQAVRQSEETQILVPSSAVRPPNSMAASAANKTGPTADRHQGHIETAKETAPPALSDAPGLAPPAPVDMNAANKAIWRYLGEHPEAIWLKGEQPEKIPLLICDYLDDLDIPYDDGSKEGCLWITACGTDKDGKLIKGRVRKIRYQFKKALNKPALHLAFQSRSTHRR